MDACVIIRVTRVVGYLPISWQLVHRQMVDEQNGPLQMAHVENGEIIKMEAGLIK